MSTYSRDQEIYKMREQEKITLKEIGERFGLTKERVRQICRKEKMQRDKMRENEWLYSLPLRIQKSLLFYDIRTRSQAKFFIEKNGIIAFLKFKEVGRKSLNALLNSL